MNRFDWDKQPSLVDYTDTMKKFLKMRSRGKNYSSKMFELLIYSRYLFNQLDNTLQDEFKTKLSEQISRKDLILISSIRNLEFRYAITIDKKLFDEFKIYYPLFSHKNTFGYYRIENYQELFEYYHDYTYGYETDLLHRENLGRAFMQYLVNTKDERLADEKLYDAMKDTAYQHKIFNMDYKSYDSNFKPNSSEISRYASYNLFKYLTNSEILNSEIPFSEAIFNFKELSEIDSDFPNIKLMIDTDAIKANINEITSFFNSTTFAEELPNLTFDLTSKLCLTYISFISEEIKTNKLKEKYRTILREFFIYLSNSDYLRAMSDSEELYQLILDGSDSFNEAIQNVLCSFMNTGRYGMTPDKTKETYKVLKLNHQELFVSYCILINVIYGTNERTVREAILNGNTSCAMDVKYQFALKILLLSYNICHLDDTHYNKIHTMGVSYKLDMRPLVETFNDEQFDLVLKLITVNMYDYSLGLTKRIEKFNIAFLLPALNGSRFNERYNNITCVDRRKNALVTVIENSRHEKDVSAYIRFLLETEIFTLSEYVYLLRIYNSATNGMGFDKNVFDVKNWYHINNLWLRNTFNGIMLEDILTTKDGLIGHKKFIDYTRIATYLNAIIADITLDDFILLTKNLYSLIKNIICTKYSIRTNDSFFRTNWIVKLCSDTKLTMELYNDFRFAFECMHKLEMIHDSKFYRELDSYIFNSTWLYTIMENITDIFSNYTTNSVRYSGKETIEIIKSNTFQSNLTTISNLFYKEIYDDITCNLDYNFENLSLTDWKNLINPVNKSLPKYTNANTDEIYRIFIDARPDNVTSGLRIYDLTLKIVKTFATTQKEAEMFILKLLCKLMDLVTTFKAYNVTEFYYHRIFRENLKYLSVSSFVALVDYGKATYNIKPEDDVLLYFILQIPYDHLTVQEKELLEKKYNEWFFNLPSMYTKPFSFEGKLTKIKIGSILRWLNVEDFVDESPEVSKRCFVEKWEEKYNEIGYFRNPKISEFRIFYMNHTESARFCPESSRISTIRDMVQYEIYREYEPQRIYNSLSPILVQIDFSDFNINVIITDTTYYDIEGHTRKSVERNLDIGYFGLNQKIINEAILSYPFDENKVNKSLSELYDRIDKAIRDIFEPVITEKTRIYYSIAGNRIVK